MTAACPACVAAPAAIEVALPKAAVQLSVPSVRCAACIGAIESHLAQVPGIHSARVNLSQKRVAVETDLPPADIAKSLERIGYEAFPLNAAALGSRGDASGQDLLMRMGVAGFAMMNVMLLSVAVWSGASGATRDLFHLISAGIALPAVLFSAQPFFQNAWRALKVGRLNMDVPISLAILLASGMSLYESLHGGHHAYFDAALSLTFFLLIGRYLERRTRSAAHSAAKELSALEEHTAQRMKNGISEVVPIADLREGDTILVTTGARVPADGRLLSGSAHTDRSFLTGESDPIAHDVGATLNAGEINLGAPFKLCVDASGTNTRLHQITQLIETAENARNRYTSLADRAARIYAPGVHLLAALTFAGWVIVSGDIRHALNISIAILIITCPCALGLAVPAVSTAAINRLYRLGFLVTSGTALERLAEVDSLVFDKTGTLTKPGFDLDLATFSQEELSVMKALSQASSHPLSLALNKHLGEISAADLTDLEEVKGAGVRAQFGSEPVALGRASWLLETGNGLELKIGDASRALPYSETLTKGAAEAVQGTQALGLPSLVLSGDTPLKTSAIADRLGIKDWHAQVSPEEKSRLISESSAQGHLSCMVGDGLNDTVALASAHASVAPGTALDAARSAADVVLLRGSLEKLPHLFRTARMAVELSKQNFAIAALYNAIAIPIAVAGYATPLMAALAMSFSSITVIFNAARVGVQK
ncbi:heavy metal translocating P-type ATPase [Cognatishimia sp.]|uniref:heavy metal translocating P-type ATPase n=1 Tax=Cognatishimia sp. TaxID=2211648 RepID=UPI00351152B7|nr:heavy metal translocating P-type ATPase [Cognatishimia sp.]